MKNDIATLHSVLTAWKICSRLRAERRRLLAHTYGRQWEDLVKTSDGSFVTEREKAERAGMKPLTNNLLRALVKSVVGRFRFNISKSGASLEELAKVRSDNFLDELDSRLLEEFLISGCAVQKVVCERRPGTELGVWVDNVNPDRFFVNAFYDPRGSDIRLLGMISDMTLPEIKLRFGHGSDRRCAMIEKCYRECENAVFPELLNEFFDDDHPVNFLKPSGKDLFRVIEVWSFDIDPHCPGEDPHWHCRILAPDGRVLDETRSPLPSGDHPFIVKLYPLVNGEVHPFIEDLIGQQKHINTLITTIDHILANSAKGVLLMPVDALPPGMDMSAVADMWSKPGGVIPINPSARQLPVEINSPGSSQGASMLLDTEMKLFQQISGVTSALQGQPAGSNMSASLYESQVYNSAIALLDIYETFNSFRECRDRKALEFVNILSR